MKKLSLIVPVYNSAESLTELAERVDAALPASAYQKELIFINDDSRDKSWQVIQTLAERYVWVRGVNLMRNYGQHNALTVGIAQATGDIIVTLDDDLQHPPEQIHKLLTALEDGADVVYGVADRVQQDDIKRLGSLFVRKLLSRSMGGGIAEHVSAFRAFSASVRPVFERYQGDYVNIDALLCWSTTRFSTVMFTHQPRKYGRSNYNFRKNLLHAINMITGFSVLPLQIASILGFLLVIFGFSLFFYVLWNYVVTHGSVQGFTFTIATISLFSGVQMFLLGIIGAYLARIHLRSMRKPLALIRETTRRHD